MCLPAIAPAAMMWASLAISAAGAGASIVAQKQQADQQATMQAAQTSANNKSVSSQMSQLRIQQAQTTEAAAREVEKARQTNQKATSTAIVASGEAGVSGNSVGALLQEYSMNMGQFQEATNRQATLNNSGIENRIEATKLSGDATNLNINAPIVGPNYLAEGLRFGDSALGAYRDYNPNAFKKTP